MATRTSRKFPLARLVALGACESQCELFKKKFGKSVDVTPALCARVARDFDFYWLETHSPWPSGETAYRETTDLFEKIRKKYEAAKRPHLDKYLAARNRYCNRYPTRDWCNSPSYPRVYGELYATTNLIEDKYAKDLARAWGKMYVKHGFAKQ